MNKKIFLLVLIIWLLFLNLSDLKGFFYNYIWNSYFKEESYDWAIKEFEKSKNISWFYDKANSLYKKWEYEEAIKEYVSILNDEKNKINFKINHNLWNSYYRLWEQDEQNKLNYRQKSVDYYKKALDIIYDEETKQNLEFVLNKINEEQNKDENNEDKDKQDWEDSWNDDNSNQNSNDKSWTWSQDQNSNWNDNNWEKWNEKDWNQDNDSKDSNSENWQDSQDSNWKESNSENWQDSNWASQGEEKNSLDKDKAEAIKQYEQSLKDIQKQNWEYFNKVYEWWTNDIFDNMFNDPFFDNSLLNDNNWEKDW